LAFVVSYVLLITARIMYEVKGVSPFHTYVIMANFNCGIFGLRIFFFLGIFKEYIQFDIVLNTFSGLQASFYTLMLSIYITIFTYAQLGIAL